MIGWLYNMRQYHVVSYQIHSLNDVSTYSSSLSLSLYISSQARSCGPPHPSGHIVIMLLRA